MRGNLPIGDWETGERGEEKITPIRPGIVPVQQRERAPAQPYEPAYACTICKDKGFLRHDVPHGHPLFGKRGIIPCRCKTAEQHQRATALTYTWTGVDDSALEDASFDGFDASLQADIVRYRQHLAYMRDYAARAVTGTPCENVLLKGSYGTGKTHLAAALLNVLRAQGKPCLYCTAQSLFNALYASDFNERYVRLASTTPLLVLDEIDKYYAKVQGDGSRGDYQKSTLGTIFNSRHQAGLPTILISNEQHDLSPWLDGWTLSRFLGNRRTLEMNGRDCRQRKDSVR